MIEGVPRQPHGVPRVELQVLLANLLRSYHYLQITDQVLAGATAAGQQGAEETRRVLGRVGVATGMLERSSGELLEQVSGLDPGCPAK